MTSAVKYLLQGIFKQVSLKSQLSDRTEVCLTSLAIEKPCRQPGRKTYWRTKSPPPSWPPSTLETDIPASDKKIWSEIGFWCGEHVLQGSFLFQTLSPLLYTSALCSANCRATLLLQAWFVGFLCWSGACLFRFTKQHPRSKSVLSSVLFSKESVTHCPACGTIESRVWSSAATS